jgi:hypothetical protein
MIDRWMGAQPIAFFAQLIAHAVVFTDKLRQLSRVCLLGQPPDQVIALLGKTSVEAQDAFDVRQNKSDAQSRPNVKTRASGVVGLLFTRLARRRELMASLGRSVVLRRLG